MSARRGRWWRLNRGSPNADCRTLDCQDREVLAKLRHPVEASAGVIEIDVPPGVEAGEFGSTKLVEWLRGSILWMGRHEAIESGHPLCISLTLTTEHTECTEAKHWDFRLGGLGDLGG